MRWCLTARTTSSPFWSGTSRMLICGVGGIRGGGSARVVGGEIQEACARRGSVSH